MSSKNYGAAGDVAARVRALDGLADDVEAVALMRALAASRMARMMLS